MISAFGLAALFAPLRADAAFADRTPLRMSFSESIVPRVNRGDARAALLVWIRILSREMDLPVEHDPEVFEPIVRIRSRLQAGTVDAVTVGIREYASIAAYVDPNQIIVQGSSVPLQYVLLVRSDSGIRKLADLKGRRLIRLDTPTTSLAIPWLSTLLMGESAPPGLLSFAEETTAANPNQVILPVFFGQADAGLATMESFSTACELNPQVAQRLTVLASSPEFVTSFYVFRKGYRSELRDKLTEALKGLKASPHGRQLLAMFQVGELAERDASSLKASLDVLARAERIRAATGRKGAGE